MLNLKYKGIKMNLKDTIKKINVAYKNHQDIDEILTDLKDESCIGYWGTRFCEDEFPQNLELAKELFIIEQNKLSKENDINGTIELIDNIAKDFKDKVWAEEIAKKVLNTKIEDNDSMLRLFISVVSPEILNNQELGTQCLNKLNQLELSAAQYIRLAEATSKYINDISLAKDFITKALDSEDCDTSDIINAADVLAQEDCINDKVEAKRLYKSAQNKAIDLEEYNKLLSSINSNLNDKEFLESIITEVKLKLKEDDDFFEFAGDCTEIMDLGRFIADENILDNKESAKEIFNLLLQYKEIYDLLDTARAVIEVYEDTDEDYKNEFLIAIINKAEGCIEQGYYCDLYSLMIDDLGDEDMADEFKENYYDEMVEDGCEE